MSASRTSSASPTSESDRYPPPPWHLGGQSHVHLFLVRRDRLPATPPGFRPLVLAGHGLVVAGWVHYQRGVLTYGELFAAVAGFARGRLTGRGGRSIPPGSPLAFLRGARRLLSTGLGDFDAKFG